MKTNSIAVLSRGESIDYKVDAWQIQGSALTQGEIDKQKNFLDLNGSDPNGFQILVHHSRGKFSCLLTGKAAHKDNRERDIRLSVLFDGLEESLARKVAIAALLPEESKALLEKLQQGIVFNGDAADPVFQKYGWKADFAKLAEVLECPCFANLEVSGNASLSRAWERDNEQDARKKLANELKSHVFSGGDGAKLVVAVAPQTAWWKKAQEEADRLLWCGADETNLTELRERKRQEEEQKRRDEAAAKEAEDRKKKTLSEFRGSGTGEKYPLAENLADSILDLVQQVFFLSSQRPSDSSETSRSLPASSKPSRGLSQPVQSGSATSSPTSRGSSTSWIQALSKPRNLWILRAWIAASVLVGLALLLSLASDLVSQKKKPQPNPAQEVKSQKAKAD